MEADVSRGSKITIRTESLIASLREEIERRKEDHRGALRAYPKLVKQWQRDAEAALKQAIVAVKEGKPVGNLRWSSIEIPSYPSKPRLDICALESTVKALKGSAKPTMSLFPDEFSKYFPCRLTRNDDDA